MHYEDLFLLTAAGGVLMDLWEARVDNRWILLSLGCGLFAHSIRDGPKGLISGLLGVLSAFALLFWLHPFRMLGAGDIKLFCALGAFLDIVQSLYLILASFLTGAIFSVIFLIMTGSFRLRFQYFLQYINRLRTTGKITPYIRPGLDKPENFHFTLAILAGALSLQAGGLLRR